MISVKFEKFFLRNGWLDSFQIFCIMVDNSLLTTEKCNECHILNLNFGYFFHFLANLDHCAVKEIHWCLHVKDACGTHVIVCCREMFAFWRCHQSSHCLWGEKICPLLGGVHWTEESVSRGSTPHCSIKD